MKEYLFLTVLFLIFSCEYSYACPNGQYEQCVFGACVCVPEIGGDVGHAAEHLKNEIKGQTGGPIVEQYIIQSRNNAINGAMPIPPQIRQALTGYASERSMNLARYKIGDNGVINLGHLTMQWGDAQAITLIDVIVFRGPSEANDVALWAHELTHVDQYADWGVRDFAIVYTRNSNDAEAPAYAKGNGYWAWAQSRGGFNNAGFPQQQVNLGAFCLTQIGRFGPGPVQTFGTPCSVQTPQGVLQGQVGP